MSTVYGFSNKRDVKRLLAMADKFERSQTNSKQSRNLVRQEARYAKITAVLDPGPPANKDKEGMGVAVKWDAETFDWVTITENPALYDAILLDSEGVTIFMTTNITSPSAMAVDDIVLLQHYPHLSETSDWLVVETGGGTAGTRVFIIVTAVISAAEYTGNVVTSPDDSTIVDTAVTIKIYGGLFNALEVGYAAFADATVDTEGVKTYYFDGAVLG